MELLPINILSKRPYDKVSSLKYLLNFFLVR